MSKGNTKVKYVGTSHIRKISKASFAAIGINHDDLVIDARVDRVATVTKEVADWLKANEGADWRFAKDAEEADGAADSADADGDAEPGADATSASGTSASKAK